MITALALLMQAPEPADDPYRLQAWADCIITQRATFAASAELPETLATATLSACHAAERAARAATIAIFRQNFTPGDAQREADRGIADTRASYREALIEYFVRARLPQK